MHPPLDRPHPDCMEIIQALKSCHVNNTISKYFGVCNDTKFALDKCFKAEKYRLLSEMNAKELPQFHKEQAEFIKKAFGQSMTFQEYLQQDKEYLAVKRQQEQQKSV
jgi:COX assembly mitochondrial protein 2